MKNQCRSMILKMQGQNQARANMPPLVSYNQTMMIVKSKWFKWLQYCYSMGLFYPSESCPKAWESLIHFRGQQPLMISMNRFGAITDYSLYTVGLLGHPNFFGGYHLYSSLFQVCSNSLEFHCQGTKFHQGFLVFHQSAPGVRGNLLQQVLPPDTTQTFFKQHKIYAMIYNDHEKESYEYELFEIHLLCIFNFDGAHVSPFLVFQIWTTPFVSVSAYSTAENQMNHQKSGKSELFRQKTTNEVTHISVPKGRDM